MTTADRHTDLDPTERQREGGAYRADEPDSTGYGAAAVDSTEREHRDYTDRQDSDPDAPGTDPATDATRTDDTGYDTSYDTGEHAGAERLDAQDADARAASDPSAVSDGTRTEGGYPHSAETTGSAGDEHAADHPADDGDSTSGVRTVDVGGSDATDAQHSGTAAVAGSGTAPGPGSDKLERLVPGERVEHYTSRWDAVKGEFVDEPRQAVAKADQLVGELLDELDQLFRKQRSDLEHGLDADETSTEDLRLALRRYRSFFDRLLQL